MSKDELIVNGHSVPAVLVAAINDGWIADVNKAEVGERLGVTCSYLHFDRIEYLSGRSAESWLRLPDEYLGTLDGPCQPGDIDPLLSLVIGETQSDSPLALDYRTTPPSVVTNPWPQWVRIADEVDDFLEKLDPGGFLRGRHKRV